MKSNYPNAANRIILDSKHSDRVISAGTPPTLIKRRLEGKQTRSLQEPLPRASRMQLAIPKRRLTTKTKANFIISQKPIQQIIKMQNIRTTIKDVVAVTKSKKNTLIYGIKTFFSAILANTKKFLSVMLSLLHIIFIGFFSCFKLLLYLFYAAILFILTVFKAIGIKIWRTCSQGCNIHVPVRRSLSDLNRMLVETYNKLTIVLDLDETLINTSLQKPKLLETNYLDLTDMDGERYFVYKRPGVDYFLQQVIQLGEVIIFTSAQKEYAERVIQFLDKRGQISKSYFRESCKRENNTFIKELSSIGVNLARTVVIDDSPLSYKFNKENAIQIRPWFRGIDKDESLSKILKILQNINQYPDIRLVLPHMLDILKF